jgi:hypothetical protein
MILKIAEVNIVKEVDSNIIELSRNLQKWKTDENMNRFKFKPQWMKKYDTLFAQTIAHSSICNMHTT